MPKLRQGEFDPTRRQLLAATVAVSSGLFLPAIAAENPRQVAATKRAKFDIQQFVQECIDANKEREPQPAVLEVLARAVRDPRAVLNEVGPPSRAGISILHRSDALTIFNAAWTPQMNLMPHNHLMWANIGIYTGREDNLFWRRSGARIEAFGAKALFAGDVTTLPVDVIHSVTNPLLRFTGGIHIYGGDFFDTARRQWDPETLGEEPSDGAAIKEIFERENQRLGL